MRDMLIESLHTWLARPSLPKPAVPVLNSPISINVGRMRDATITLVHRTEPAVHERSRAISCSTRAGLQPGGRTCFKAKVPSMGIVAAMAC